MPRSRACANDGDHFSEPYVRFAPITTELPRRSGPPLGARNRREQVQQIWSLLDHLIGAGKEHW
jgi:hypothetical protein